VVRPGPSAHERRPAQPTRRPPPTTIGQWASQEQTSRPHDARARSARAPERHCGAVRGPRRGRAPRDHALVSLLALNGLRVSEAITADLAALGLERGHRTLTVVHKGGKVATMPLAPRVARAVDLAIGDRLAGPIFVESDGRRVDRHAAGRIVRRVARRAGIVKRVGPHTLRHAFITAALDAGVPLRDVQEAASHADPRTTMRYDRGRQSLDRHATYIVATFIAGASR
jgi:integrase/recombinase XerD